MSSNICPLLGIPTLCRIAINWNRSSDVLLDLHATGHRYEKTASVTAVMNDLKWESLHGDQA